MLRPGPDDPFWIVVAVVGLVVAAWLALRRRQLLAVAAAPEALADAFASTVTGRDVWERAAKNLTAGRVVAAARPRRSRPLRLLNGMWRGIKLTGVLQQLVGREELAPLMPGRLRGIGMLVVACLIAGIVLSLAILVAFLLPSWDHDTRRYMSALAATTVLGALVVGTALVVLAAVVGDLVGTFRLVVGLAVVVDGFV